LVVNATFHPCIPTFTTDFFNSSAMVESDSRSATLADEKEHGRSVSPSPLPSIDKEEQPAVTANTTDNEGSLKDGSVKADEGAAAVDDGEYATGMKLGLIILSLLLSIFLVGHIVLLPTSGCLRDVGFS
jgi:hypothetical protein